MRFRCYMNKFGMTDIGWEYHLFIGKMHMILKHFKMKTSHGPQSEPKLMTVRLYELPDVQKPSWGKRLWFYFKWKDSFYIDFYMDHRPRV